MSSESEELEFSEGDVPKDFFDKFVPDDEDDLETKKQKDALKEKFLKDPTEKNITAWLKNTKGQKQTWYGLKFGMVNSNEIRAKYVESVRCVQYFRVEKKNKRSKTRVLFFTDAIIRPLYQVQMVAACYEYNRIFDCNLFNKDEVTNPDEGSPDWRIKHFNIVAKMAKIGYRLDATNKKKTNKYIKEIEDMHTTLKKPKAEGDREYKKFKSIRYFKNLMLLGDLPFESGFELPFHKVYVLNNIDPWISAQLFGFYAIVVTPNNNNCFVVSPRIKQFDHEFILKQSLIFDLIKRNCLIEQTIDLRSVSWDAFYILKIPVETEELIRREHNLSSEKREEQKGTGFGRIKYGKEFLKQFLCHEFWGKSDHFDILENIFNFCPFRPPNLEKFDNVSSAYWPYLKIDGKKDEFTLKFDPVKKRLTSINVNTLLSPETYKKLLHKPVFISLSVLINEEVYTETIIKPLYDKSDQRNREGGQKINFQSDFDFFGTEGHFDIESKYEGQIRLQLQIFSNVETSPNLKYFVTSTLEVPESLSLSYAFYKDADSPTPEFVEQKKAIESKLSHNIKSCETLLKVVNALTEEMKSEMDKKTVVNTLKLLTSQPKFKGWNALLVTLARATQFVPVSESTTPAVINSCKTIITTFTPVYDTQVIFPAKITFFAIMAELKKYIRDTKKYTAEKFKTKKEIGDILFDFFNDWLKDTGINISDYLESTASTVTILEKAENKVEALGYALFDIILKNSIDNAAAAPSWRMRIIPNVNRAYKHEIMKRGMQPCDPNAGVEQLGRVLYESLLSVSFVQFQMSTQFTPIFYGISLYNNLRVVNGPDKADLTAPPPAGSSPNRIRTKFSNIISTLPEVKRVTKEHVYMSHAAVNDVAFEVLCDESLLKSFIPEFESICQLLELDKANLFTGLNISCFLTDDLEDIITVHKIQYALEKYMEMGDAISTTYYKTLSDTPKKMCFKIQYTFKDVVSDCKTIINVLGDPKHFNFKAEGPNEDKLMKIIDVLNGKKAGLSNASDICDALNNNNKIEGLKFVLKIGESTFLFVPNISTTLDDPGDSTNFGTDNLINEFYSKTTENIDFKVCLFFKLDEDKTFNLDNDIVSTFLSKYPVVYHNCRFMITGMTCTAQGIEYESPLINFPRLSQTDILYPVLETINAKTTPEKAYSDLSTLSYGDYGRLIANIKPILLKFTIITFWSSELYSMHKADPETDYFPKDNIPPGITPFRVYRVISASDVTNIDLIGKKFVLKESYTGSDHYFCFVIQDSTTDAFNKFVDGNLCVVPVSPYTYNCSSQLFNIYGTTNFTCANLMCTTTSNNSMSEENNSVEGLAINSLCQFNLSKSILRSQDPRGLIAVSSCYGRTNLQRDPQFKQLDFRNLIFQKRSEEETKNIYVDLVTEFLKKFPMGEYKSILLFKGCKLNDFVVYKPPVDVKSTKHCKDLNVPGHEDINCMLFDLKIYLNAFLVNQYETQSILNQNVSMFTPVSYQTMMLSAGENNLLKKAPTGDDLKSKRKQLIKQIFS